MLSGLMNLRLNEAWATKIASSKKAPMASVKTALRRPEVFGSSRIGLVADKSWHPEGAGDCPHYRELVIVRRREFAA